MRRRELLFAANDTGEGTILDVLFSKNDGSSLEIFSPGEWPDASGYTPIGIVVVPASHNRYGDGSCGVVSVKFMNYNTPTDGGKRISMYGGYYGESMENNIFSSRNVLTNVVNYIPYQSDTDANKTTIFQGNVVWPYGGTTTVPTTAASTTYSNEGGYVQATSGLAGCDFNGIRNTAATYVKTKNSNQWTASTIENTSGSTNTPPAACCARYKTLGTKAFIDIYSGITSNNINYGTSASTKTNFGYWYMPALGEITYLARYYYTIMDIFNRLSKKYGTDAASEFKTSFLYICSSTEVPGYSTSPDDIGLFEIITVQFSIAKYRKTLNHAYALAFLRFNPNTIDDYEYVDLGLPSGLKWAKYNVGASSETEYGNYYQYGKGSATYQTTSAQSIYNKTDNVLPLSADTAQQVMHGGWRMPTSGECEELLHNTTSEYIMYGSGSQYITGVRFTSKKDSSKSIFIPAGGNYSDGVRRNSRKSFSIWCSTSYDRQDAYRFYKNYDYQSVIPLEYALRKYGYNVRGVHA